MSAAEAAEPDGTDVGANVADEGEDAADKDEAAEADADGLYETGLLAELRRACVPEAPAAPTATPEATRVADGGGGGGGG